ncbi:MAG: TIGR04222 domain-containing membrane protein [Clostridia bacterium]|nr:TIGR04222 domain-containing membrane protein [Clostridia bacterium]
MLDAFIAIPGPLFLLFYCVLSVVCIYMGWRWSNDDGSTRYPLPSPTQLDSISVAALKGGPRHVIQTVTFSLWSRKFISIEGNGNSAMVQSTTMDDSSLTAIEKEILDYVRQPKKVSELSNIRFVAKIKSLLEPVYMQLTELRLIKTPDDEKRTSLARRVILAILMSIGGFKLLLGITRDKPVLFLVIAMVFSFVATLLVISGRSDNLTVLGRNYLKSLSDHFRWLKKPQNSSSTYYDIDPAFSFSLFGLAVLSDDIFSPYRNAFGSYNTNSSGYTTGDSSFISSDSGDSDNGSNDSGSSDSGGGCGGGSDSGGGCGGCGGGCGGS